jgi:hypothetical protein
MPTPVTELPLWKRIPAGAFIGAGGMAPATLIVWLMAACDGRYQQIRSTEWDMWVLSATYPLGTAAAGALVVGLGQYARRLWQAAALGVAAALPAVYLIGMAADRRAPGGWRPDWGATWLLAVLLGGGVGAALHREIAARRAAARPPDAPPDAA